MISPEIVGARMPDHDVPGLVRRPRADLAERRLQFVDQEINRVSRSLGAQCANAPQESLARECSFCPERKRAGDVSAAAHTGVEQHRGFAANRLHDRGHAVDDAPGQQMIECR